jgi:hypothetical protein
MSDHSPKGHIGLFPIGRIHISPKLAQEILHRQLDLLPYLVRHINGDWGDVEDRLLNYNDYSVRHGGSIYSAYDVAEELNILITTEADRSVTSLILAEEDLSL